MVVELLVAMDYGGSRQDAGEAVGGSVDDEVDGIIKEDRLGLDAIYLQAKRWGGTIGRQVVQASSASVWLFILCAIDSGLCHIDLIVITRINNKIYY